MRLTNILLLLWMAFIVEIGADSSLYGASPHQELTKRWRNLLTDATQQPPPAQFNSPAPPPLQVNYDIPSLQVNVKGLRFFEGGSDGVPYAERTYAASFSPASSRYIYWELDLEFSPHPKRLDFQLTAVWYNPDGSELFRQDGNFYILPEWGYSYHSYGFGWPQPGNWKAGTYRVDIFFSGVKVASNSFTIMDNSTTIRNNSSYDIPSLQANIDSIKFFEGGYHGLPIPERQYKTEFSRSSSKYIFLDLALKHPTHPTKVDFHILAIWYRPDGSEMDRHDFTFSLEPDWTSSSIPVGYGWDNPGNWPLGTYRVELFVDQQRIARGSFEITP